MKEQKREVRHRKLHGRRQYDEMVGKASLLGHIKSSYEQKVQEAIRNRVASYSSSVRNTSLELRRMVREMHHDVADIKTVEVPEESFNMTFILHLMLGTREASSRID